MSEFEALSRFLATCHPGPISAKRYGEIESLLSQCWNGLEVQGGGMTPDKIQDRVEKLHWAPPELTFEIERHGGIVVGGSSRAEMQIWCLNVETRTAKFSKGGHRQKKPISAKFDATAAAVDVRELIIQRKADPRLKWNPDGSVTVATGIVVPETKKQTTQVRRKRFARELQTQLAGTGWIRRLRGNRLVFECAP